jgi:hypothetical protein
MKQEAPKKLSSRSYRIIAKGSGHYIHYDRPELLVREVGSLVRQINDGTTTWGNDATKAE